MPELCRHTNDILKNISEYLYVNYLHLNVSKTKYIVFDHLKPTLLNALPCKIIFNGCALERVNKIKFLRVVIDENLNWGSHLSHISTKLSKVSDILYNLRKSLPPHLTKPVFNALVNSQLSYAISVWGGNFKLRNKLFVFQKRAIRSLYGLWKKRTNIKKFKLLTGTKKTFINNDHLTIHNLYHYSIITESFKALSSSTPL